MNKKSIGFGRPGIELRRTPEHAACVA